MNNIASHTQDSSSIVSTDTEPSGWGFFSEEISWFLFDFFDKQLEPAQKLIFFSYYVTGMTIEEIAERMHSPSQVNRFEDEGVTKKDDEVIEDPDSFHCSHQAIHAKIVKINEMLRHAWQYSDRWKENYERSRKGNK